jgi:hypothetical protein
MNKGDVMHAYLSYNIVAIQQQNLGIALKNEEISGKSISASNSALCINEAILCL